MISQQAIDRAVRLVEEALTLCSDEQRVEFWGVFKDEPKNLNALELNQAMMMTMKFLTPKVTH